MVTTIAILVFLVIILLLVSLLLFTKQTLAPQGTAPVDVNDGERSLAVETGFSLLTSLSINGIFLPSACGGGGTCGLCKCQVVSGGGGILPTEVGFFTRRQQQENWRLACQVKMRESLAVKIPEEILGIKRWECEVVSNRNVATFIKELVVKLPAGQTLNFKSGGYIQMNIPPCEVDFSKDIEVDPEFRKDWDRMKIWDLKMKNPEPTFRAYSMANHPAEGNIVMLNVRIATPPWSREKGFDKVNPGVCSSYIFSRKPGDKITISGPYGEFFLRDTQSEMMFIGGGAGMAPMRSHIFNLFQTIKTGRKVTFWYGARSLREVFYEEQFRAIEKKFPNFKLTIALSDPQPQDEWAGATGFIHQVIYDCYLKNHKTPEDIEYYLCGPPMMTAAATKMLCDLGVPDEMVMFDNFGG
ncbi:MAG: NADH:ubiquinone reductase (Na(+)-transporting) subunit F [Prevotellaceae bacterium]|jgi:Na+-transporting NADH:ubiquinone oxidoreductase subunit F|nr:NADH:ubiquinone reductase (Na(+)-transporting) subunit F [Prevotellaceae bacterium]